MTDHHMQKTKRTGKAAQDYFHKLPLFAGVLASCWTAAALAQTGASVTLAWDPAPGIASYRLYEGTTSQAYATNFLVGAAPSATVGGLTVGATYYFAVTALGTNGLESPLSAQVAFTVPTPPPPASGASVTLAWDPAPGIASYRLYEGTTSQAYATNFLVGATPSTTVAGLTVGTTYYFAITALGTNGLESPLSGQVAYTVPTTPAISSSPNFAASAGTITAASSLNNGVLSQAVQPAQLPAPWLTQDIGNPGAPGNAYGAAGQYSVSGAGNLSGLADNLRFLYQPMSGNGEIRARITDLQNSSPTSEAGIMVREALTPGSTYAFMGLASSNTYRLQSRSTTSASTVATNLGSASLLHSWVRLVRSNNALLSYTSADGVTWASTGAKTIPMATNVYVGLAVASGRTNALSTATFTNLTVVP